MIESNRNKLNDQYQSKLHYLVHQSSSHDQNPLFSKPISKSTMITLAPTDYFLFVTVATLFYFTMVHKHKRDKLLDVFPGPTRPPIIGHTLDLLFTREAGLIPKMVRWCEEYGSVFKVFGGTQRLLVLSHPKHVEKVLGSDTHGEGFEYDFYRLVVSSKGHKSSHRSKLYTLGFHSKVEQIPVFNRESLKLVEILCGYANGRVVDIVPYVSNCALDIVCETVMGKMMNCQGGENLEYSRGVTEFGELARKRASTPRLWDSSGLDKRQVSLLEGVDGVTDSVIRERKEIRGELKFGAGQRNKSFLDLLLDAQDEVRETQLTDQDVREETLAVVLREHVTTCRSISSCLYALGCFPDVQDKVRDELTTLFGNNKTRPVSLEDLSKMKYLECVVRESLRMFPSVPFLQRYLAEDFEIDENVRVPGDVHLGLFVYAMHRNPEYFDEPDVFKPERFSDRVGPFVYVPLSDDGVVGVKVVLVNLVRSFRIEVEGKEGVGVFGGLGNVYVSLKCI